MSGATGETWLFDLGNSRAKAARLADGRPADVCAFEWDRLDLAQVVAARLAGWGEPKRVLVASVASQGNAARLRRLLPDSADVQQHWLQSPRRACGVRNRYARPERLGIDRFLALVAARVRAPGGAVVVGCGTALTLDALDAQGMQAAGLITLSPEGARGALQRATAIADGNPDAFGTSTGDDTALAIADGAWAAAGALVGWYADRQRGVLGEVPVWLHGGWSDRMAAWLQDDGRRVEVFRDAVLHGLAAWAADPGLE